MQAFLPFPLASLEDSAVVLAPAVVGCTLQSSVVSRMQVLAKDDPKVLNMERILYLFLVLSLDHESLFPGTPLCHDHGAASCQARWFVSLAL